MTSSAIIRNQRSVIKALSDEGVAYAVLRGSLGGGDLDLLVAPADVRRSIAVLERMGVLPTPSEHHWPHRLLVGRADASSEPGEPPVDVVVDVLDRLVVRTLHLGGPDLVDQILANRVLDEDGVPRPGPSESAWIDVLSVLLGPSDSMLPAPHPELDLTSLVALAIDADCRPGTAARVADAVGAGQTGTVRAELVGPPSRRRWTDVLVSRRALWMSRLGMPAGRTGRTGVRVALLGPDGAGKSTLSKGLVEALPLPVHEIYMGVFRMSTWHRVSRYLPGAGLATRLATLTWRSTKGRWYARRGHVVVFDRYTYDAGLRPGSRGLRSRLSYSVIERAVKPPDLVIVLDAPGTVMFERKLEHDIATLEERRGWYLNLAQGLPNATVIDATLPPDEVLDHAIDAVWRTIKSR